MQIHLPLTDFLHSILQLVSLEKYDEDRFVDLITLWKHHQVKLENTHLNYFHNSFICEQHLP